ncbi:hypothetical protein NIES22_61050 [Calothrix brevissima NIES-22]|nr:hypothetical protein NIES22_61050 [Calothrix brevissima NIES-22]
MGIVCNIPPNQASPILATPKQTKINTGIRNPSLECTANPIIPSSLSQKFRGVQNEPQRHEVHKGRENKKKLTPQN